MLTCCSDTATPPAPAGPSTFVTYAGAASQLRGLGRAEQVEQLRDWARTGLAAELELDTARLRDSSYDTVPVRDPGFAELARQPIGPGRALFDGRMLHVLVPKDDPHRARTIGLLIDQHRADAGVDPEQVQVQAYQVHPLDQTIELTAHNPTSIADARAANGWVSMRVDQAGGLTDFLKRARHLSTMEVRGTEIWASGWEWPDVSAALLDHQDVSAIQRGYRQPKNEPLPGFSLDPGPLKTAADVRAVVPGLSEDWAQRLVEYWEHPKPSDFADLIDTVERALVDDKPAPAELAAQGLPSSRIGLWALDSLLSGAPVYAEARYDGRLAGTNVGMTMFYTDYIAKNWANGVGNSLPDRAVGFVPNTEAVTPWAHCRGADEPGHESGRLWFGQNDSAFDFTGTRVDIGAQATRLFAKSNGEAGTEVESSFAFGRGLRWWDEHYQAVADYESQYQRLDQIMRWSGALEWLTTKTSAKLPQLDDASIRSDLTFKTWYATTSTLKERSPVEFAAPPSAEQESVRHIPSETFADCGRQAITGGVSLGDVLQRKGAGEYRPDVPGPARRAGTFAEGSTFDRAAGTADLTQISLDSAGKVADRVQRKITPGKDGSAVVETVGGGRRVEPFGDVKVVRKDASSRAIGVELSAGKGTVRESVNYENHDVGTLRARKVENQEHLVVVEWRPGPMERARRVFASIQKLFVSEPGGKIPTARDGALLRYEAGDRVSYKVGGNEFVEISENARPPGDGLVFQLGRPHPDTKLPQFFEANLSRGPPPGRPAVAAGQGPWMKITPTLGEGGAHASRSGPPDASARQVRVSTPDGQSTSASVSGKDLWVHEGNPLVGLWGRPEGAAMLGRFPSIDAAMRDAGVAHDGLLRAVSLGEDGVALASATEVVVVAADHPWAVRVGESNSFGRTQPVLVRLDGNNAVVVGREEFVVDNGIPAQHELLGKVPSAGGDVYVDEAIRSITGYTDGRLHTDALPRDRKVVIRRAIVRPPVAQDSIPVRGPDIRVRNGREWTRVGGSGSPDFLPTFGGGNGPPPGNGGGPPTATPDPGPGGSVPTIGPEVFVVIYLVCLDDDSNSADRCGNDASR